MPTDRRTSAGSTSSGEPATDRWVIAAGTSMSDSTPPSDSASVKRCVPSAMATARSAAVRPSGTSGRHERDHPAEPGVEDGRHVAAPAQERRDGRGIRRRAAPSAGAASAARAGPGSNRADPGTAPIAFWRKRSRSAAAASEVTAMPRIVSEWPARYFVAEWKTMSAPTVSGRWSAGDANVLSTTISGRAPPLSAARRATVGRRPPRCRRP